MTDEEIWLQAWLAVAPSFNAKVDDCTRYADKCLAAFHERFPPPAQAIEAAGAGETREAGLDAKHESAVGEADAPKGPTP